LRQGNGAAAACVFLDYGPHGGGHGHMDKLQLLLYANGREWLLDPGRLNYSQPEYKTWVKETAAHNTVTLGGQSQRATTGKLLWLQKENDFVACAAQSDAAYDGTKLTRRLLLTPLFLVDIFDVEAAQETQIDWFVHSTAASLLPVVPRATTNFLPGTTNGYQHLIDAQSFTAQSSSQWDFLSDTNKPDALRLRVWLVNDGLETIATTNGIGYTVAEKTPTLMRRRTAQKTRFIAVYDLSGNGNGVRDVKAEKNGALQIVTAAGNWRVSFGETGATLRKN
jgi:hypothetical protein